MPSTPWHHTHHWVDDTTTVAAAVHRARASSMPAPRSGDAVPREWLYEPTWPARPLPTTRDRSDGRWVVLADAELGAEFGRALGSRVTVLPPAALDGNADLSAVVDESPPRECVLYAPPVTGPQVDVDIGLPPVQRGQKACRSVGRRAVSGAICSS